MSVSWATVFTGCFAVITPSAFTAIAKGLPGMPKTRAQSSSGTARTRTPAGSRSTLSLPGAITAIRDLLSSPGKSVLAISSASHCQAVPADRVEPARTRRGRPA
jgi:hypothetical protein